MSRTGTDQFTASTWCVSFFHTFFPSYVSIYDLSDQGYDQEGNYNGQRKRAWKTADQLEDPALLDTFRFQMANIDKAIKAKGAFSSL
eukprot:SAG31_NODE_11297_length_1044_cov_1.610582_2_plen_87_part_00